MACDRIAAEAARFFDGRDERSQNVQPICLPIFRRNWAVFLDFDGTLVDIASTPDQVQLSSALREAVTEKRKYLRGALAIITGRQIKDIDRYFTPLVLSCAGQHGAELRLPNGALELIGADDGSRARLRSAASRLREFVGHHAGLMLEEKKLTLTLHYRNAPHLAERSSIEVRLAVRDLAGLDVRDATMAIEIVDGHVDKGRVLRRLMQHPTFRGRIPVYAGDDSGDEPAIKAAQDLGGFGIRILKGRARSETCARYRVPNRSLVENWLRGPTDWTHPESKNAKVRNVLAPDSVYSQGPGRE